MSNNFAERARALVGCRFRPQGRDPQLGLDCVGLIVAAYRIPAVEVPRDYRLRGNQAPRLARELDRYFRRVPPTAKAAGDVLLFEIAPEQLHLAVCTERGFVHADARLRRLVETPGEPPWKLAAAYRRRARPKRDG